MQSPADHRNFRIQIDCGGCVGNPRHRSPAIRTTQGVTVEATAGLVVTAAPIRSLVAATSAWPSIASAATNVLRASADIVRSRTGILRTAPHFIGAATGFLRAPTCGVRAAADFN